MTGETPRTARELLGLGREFLERKGVENPRLEAELLLAHALGLARLALFLDLERPVAPPEVQRGRDLFVRRGKGEPTAYLTGEREFYGRAFRVGAGVLIPRPETELLVDRARELLADVVGPSILDVGTGSGCLAVTLALELEGARVAGVDASERALGYARDNGARLGAEVEWIAGDGFATLAGRSGLDLVVCNPPYVDPARAEELGPGLLFEPPEALFAPAGDVDAWARRLLGEAPPRLAPGGALLVELGHDQAARLAPELAPLGGRVRLHRDLAGIERVLELRTPARRAT